MLAFSTRCVLAAVMSYEQFKRDAKQGVTIGDLMVRLAACHRDAEITFRAMADGTCMLDLERYRLSVAVLRGSQYEVSAPPGKRLGER